MQHCGAQKPFNPHKNVYLNWQFTWGLTHAVLLEYKYIHTSQPYNLYDLETLKNF